MWCVAGGAAVRLAGLAAKWSDPLPLADALWYSASAVQIAQGNGFVDPFEGGPSAEHGPLTPLVLAAVSWIDNPVGWQRLVNTVAGIATVALIAWLAHLVAGRRAAIAAGAIAAVYPNLWLNDSAVMSESLACLLVVAATIAAWRTTSGHHVRWAVGAGAAAGLATLARSELGLVVVGLAIVVALGARRDDRRQAYARAATIVGVGSLVLAPWVGANLVRFEQPVLLTTNDGTTLLGSNCADTYRRTSGFHGGWSLNCLLTDGSAGEPEPSVRASQQRHAALSYARAHVGQLPIVAAARLARTSSVYRVANLVDGDVGEGKARWAVWSGVVAWWLLAPFAAVGLTTLGRRGRAVLLVPIVAVAVTTVLFYGGHRVRAVMAVVVAAAACVVSLIDRRRST
jgi:4-amino-4-deoxy-L-arabinose transferase-like glycosyltransferase